MPETAFEGPPGDIDFMEQVFPGHQHVSFIRYRVHVSQYVYVSVSQEYEQEPPVTTPPLYFRLKGKMFTAEPVNTPFPNLLGENMLSMIERQPPTPGGHLQPPPLSPPE